MKFLMEYLVKEYPQIQWFKDDDNKYRGIMGEHYIALECEKKGWDTWVTKSQIKGMVEVLEEKVKEMSA